MNDKPKISYVEAVIVLICSYSIIGNMFLLAGTIEKIIFGGVVAILYLKLLNIEYLNVVLKTLAAILWTLLVSAIFYTFVSIGVITAVFAVIMFILFMWLHELRFIKWAKSVVSIIKRILVKKEKIKFNGVKTKNPDPAYKELRNAMSLFLDTYWKYKSYIEKSGKQDSKLYIDTTEANSNTVSILQECANHKFYINGETKQWMQYTTKVYNTLIGCMEMEMSPSSQYTKKSSNASAGNKSNNTTNNTLGRKTNDIDESLFSGCDSEESLKTRYHQLMKMYHPDSQNGDTEMSQKVQRTYKELSAIYRK